MPADYLFVYTFSDEVAQSPTQRVVDWMHDINRVNIDLRGIGPLDSTKALYQMANLPNQLFHLDIYYKANMVLQLYSIAVNQPIPTLDLRVQANYSTALLPSLDELSDLFFIRDYEFIRFKRLSKGHFVGNDIRHATYGLVGMILDSEKFVKHVPSDLHDKALEVKQSILNDLNA
jgi:hypothetical protein